MRRTRTLAITCGLIFSTACTGTDDDPPSTTPTSPEPPTQTTAPPTEPEPPQLPALAHQETTAGAKAFITYYIDTINYGYTLGDPDPMTQAATNKCNVCSSLVQSVHDLKSNGGHQEGGQWTILASFPAPDSTRRIQRFTVRIEIAKSVWQATESSEPQTFAARQATQVFSIRLGAHGWQIDEINDI